MCVPLCLPSVPLLSSKALEKHFQHLVDLIACNFDGVSPSFAQDLIQLKVRLIPGWDGLQVLRKPGLGFKMVLVRSRNGLLPTAMGSSPALRGGSGCPCGDLGEGAWGGGRQRSALRAAPVFMRCSAQAVLFAFFH